MTKKILIYFCAATAVFIFFEQALAQSIPTQVIVTIIPNAPTDLTAVPNSSSQVGLSWTNNALDADYVSVERKTGVGGTYAEIATTTPDISTYLDNSVAPSTIYFYRVRAFEGGLYSSYSGEASVSTPASSGGSGGGGGGGGSGGGGGGGGGYVPPPPSSPTNVEITGSAYPGSKVFILKDGQIALQTVAGPDANFSATIGDLSAGNYTFSIYAEDSAGLRSTVFTFPVMVTTGVTTMVSGVFLSPTISVDKSEVKQGDTLTIFGESVPSSTIMIQVNSTQTIFAHTTSSASGAYLYDLDTSPLAMGSHSTKSKAQAGSLISQQSIAVGFTVGTENVTSTPTSLCPPNYPRGDLNDDCHVNLVDFSILAYWWQRSGFPAGYNLDGGTIIDLADFSIMAYYWTG
jgi:hypothetical protein